MAVSISLDWPVLEGYIIGSGGGPALIRAALLMPERVWDIE